MSQRKTSEEIMAEHNLLLGKKVAAFNSATAGIRAKYDPQLKQLMAEFVVARGIERVAQIQEGTRPNEYSKPIDKSGCAK